MKKTFMAALALFGISSGPAQADTAQTMDPKKILFTAPTISNDIAPLDSIKEPPSKSTFMFHEDEWIQLEFFPKNRINDIQRILSEYKVFEAKNREKYGWKDIFIRRITREPVISGQDAALKVAQALNAKIGEAPVLHTSSEITGRVSNGFSISLGGNITLYGYSSPAGIPVLGALVGESPDNQKLTQAFSILNSRYDLLLVDWRQQLLLIGQTSNGSLSVWRP